jgi:hypothetical protein
MRVFARVLSALALTMPLTAALAADVSMAGGAVTFRTPDDWQVILETQGDPEVRVFQVPDPSPTAGNALARVTVTVKQVANLAEFQAYMDSAIRKAQSLTAYHADNEAGAEPNGYRYSAQESGVDFSYRERYWLKDNHAIQLRCVRPQQSQAGAAWLAAFDRGCEQIAAALR